MNQDDMVPLSDLRPGDIVDVNGEPWVIAFAGQVWVHHGAAICREWRARFDGHKEEIAEPIPRHLITFAESRGKPEEKM